jgi:F-type H+-transporting ATPase subunit b
MAEKEGATTEEHGAARADGEHAIASTTADGGHGEVHAEPTALGLDATAWVALAMLVVIGIMLWKKVPAAIGAALDRRIGAIRAQLDEANKLRAEAEALRAEYQARLDAAGAEADSLIQHARHDADLIIQQAKSESAALVERRKRMAEDKIAAAERTAVAEVRARAADAAAAAAAKLIAERHDAQADKALVDRTIDTLNN